VLGKTQEQTLWIVCKLRAVSLMIKDVSPTAACTT
jgi:hypothetical protein